MPSDPKKPFIIGLIVLAILMVGGIVWAVLFVPPSSQTGQTDVNASFNDANDPFIGKEDATVVVRAFEDFQCPACKVAKAGLDHVIRTYGDQVKVVWNDFPLQQAHPNARSAANAARCAEEQGKFWEMNGQLYDFQSSWAELRNPKDEFNKIAKGLDLNMGAFEVCYDSKKYDDKIATDMSEGYANSVNSTPTFFINNRRVSGALSPREWDTALGPYVAN